MEKKSKNPASLIAFDTTGAVTALMDAGVSFPQGALLAELSHILGAALESYINKTTIGLAPLQYGSRLFYQISMEGYDAGRDATRVGDQIGRVGRFELEESLPEALAEAFNLWHRQVRVWLHSNTGSERIRFRRKKAAFVQEDRPYDAEGLETVREFIRVVQSNVTGFCTEFVIHGSLSDMKRTAYSDLDTWMLVGQETVSDPGALRDLRHALEEPLRIAKRFDPLQHHGVFVSTEWELDFYLEARFPLILLDMATSLMGAPELTVNCVPDGVYRARALVRMAKRIRDLAAVPRKPFDIKMVTSQVMLLPALFHQLVDDYVYKPDAFVSVRGAFSPEAWRAVQAATELRALWVPDGAQNLLDAIDPHFLEHARRLGSETMDAASRMSVEDALWDEIQLGSTGSYLPAKDHPCYYSREEYGQVARQVGRAISDVPGVRSIYFLGSFESPVLGISDLDVLVVLRDDPSLEPSAAGAYGRIISMRAAPSSPMAGYIKWHEEAVSILDELAAMRGFWISKPHFCCGIDDLGTVPGKGDVPIPPEIGRTILLFKEGTFQLLRLAELLCMPVLPLRLALMRSYSITHDIVISREVFDFDMPEFGVFHERIDRLRSQWFNRQEAERRNEARDLVAYALAVVHRILAEAATRLREKGAVRIEPILRQAPFEQSVGDFLIRYEHRPEGFGDVPATADDGALVLPLEALPLIYFCRPFQAFKPPLGADELDMLLAEAYRGPAVAIRRIFEKHLLISHRLTSPPDTK
jgi:hypothetical protein